MNFEEAVAARDKMYEAFAELTEAVEYLRDVNERDSALEDVVNAAERVKSHAQALQDWVFG